MLIVVLLIIKLLAFLLGLYVTYISYKAYRTSRYKILLSLSMGFLFITIGAITEEMFIYLKRWYTVDIVGVHLVESAFLLVGLGLIFYSLFGGIVQ